VHEFVRGWQEDGIGYWVVELDAKFVGVAGVRPLQFRGRTCWNLYYRFAPEVWGMGLAVEAACEAVAVAEALHPYWPVLARTRPANGPAVRPGGAGGRGCWLDSAKRSGRGRLRCASPRLAAHAVPLTEPQSTRS